MIAADYPQAIRCPSREVLSAFNVGQLPRDLREAVDNHVEGCMLCLATLRLLDDSTDALIAELRQPAPAAPLSEATCLRVQSFVGHAEQANIRVRRYGGRDVPYGGGVEGVEAEPG